LNLLTLTLVFGIPAAIWIVSYAYLARYYEKWNLLYVPIHESGRYTLLGTIFYFNHFLREIFIDTLFVLAAFSTYRIIHPGDRVSIHSVLLPGAFLLFLAVVFLGSIREVGLDNTLLDLFQFRELDHVVKFGSHWQMHFLSTLVILLLLILPAFFSAMQTPQTLIAVGLIFLLASLFFRTGRLAISDPRWILHGGREIITFFFLAVLPFYGFVLPDVALRPSWTALWGVAAISGCLIYYAWVYRKTELRQFAQGGYGMGYLLTSHFFEHVLDYVYMCLLMLVLLQLAG
jgi:hypothetical protein